MVNELFTDGNGDDIISGGQGDDRLFGENGADTLLGDSGNDVISGGLGVDTIQGGSGYDRVMGDGEFDAILSAERIQGVPDIIVKLLSADPVGKSLQPYSLLCRPGTSREYTSVYPGDKCGFVLDGELTVTVGEETFVLAAGDSIHFDRSQPHSWHNKSVQECMVIWTVSPPLSETELET